MVMMPLVNGLQIFLQAGVRLLRTGEIAGLQGADEVLVIGVGLAVLAERLGGGGLGIVAARQSLLERGQCALGTGDVAGLQGIADGLKILSRLLDVAGIVILIGRVAGGNAGDAAHGGGYCIFYLSLKIFRPERLFRFRQFSQRL
jgi:hypothetical protein